MELASHIPGFGGYFYDGDGNLVAYVTDQRHANLARAVLNPILRDTPQRPGSASRGSREVNILLGEYTFEQLRAWRDEIRTFVFGIDGVVSLDLDESDNRVSIGLTDQRAREFIENKLWGLNIPLGAVVFINNSAEVLAQASRSMLASFSTSASSYTLQTQPPPLVGGIEIGAYNGNGVYLGWGCTLGYTAIQDGVPVFITASHCSETKWDLDSTRYLHAGSWVGSEVKDPRGQSCDVFYKCRWSDASVNQVPSDITIALGKIARTTYFGDRNRAGSLEIDSDFPQFNIIGITNPAEGTLVDKMGRSTGWTYGSVTNTCVFWQKNWQQVNCTSVADFHFATGDSGGPIFVWLGGHDVQIAGIQFGSYIDSDHGAFAPADHVGYDLGPMTVW